MENYAAFAAAFLALAIGSGLVMVENPENIDDTNLEKFESEEEFQEFVSASATSPYDSVEQRAGSEADTALSADKGAAVERSSDTNIQVSGVGEPDILKNTGKKIYYSPEQRYHYWRDNSESNTSVFQTLPAENFSETDTLPVNGRMFLTNQSIISLGENISAYNQETHEEMWNKELNADIEAARKINGSLYFVLAKNVRSDNPCPVKPLGGMDIACTSYYYPDSGTADTTYTLVEMDAETGEILNENGFVGERSNSIVYVSQDSIYLTYSETISDTRLMLDFLESEGSQYLDQDTMERIDELKSYNISDSSLKNEIQIAIEDYFSTLSDEERREAEKQLEHGVGNYTAERKRELSTTSIAKFNKNLELEAEGEVPGKVNDRFSLGESSEGLRVSTTVGNSWRFDVKPENDLYTLDHSLERQGSVKGMGLNEEIYSTRYIGDKAYVVTYRRIDPFHVIDLSNPENPELKGELKLPGFSSYLHPLQEDRILGIGEENGTVKAVIFDVEGDEPEVLDSKVLEDYYSEISDSHHAFQIDRENKVFFLPGSQGGHFFNYSEGLKHVKKVEMDNAKRAAFVNQNFYVFNNYNATVIDMEDWSTVKQVQYRNRSDPEPVPLPEPRIVE